MKRQQHRHYWLIHWETAWNFTNVFIFLIKSNKDVTCTMLIFLILNLLLFFYIGNDFGDWTVRSILHRSTFCSFRPVTWLQVTVVWIRFILIGVHPVTFVYSHQIVDLSGNLFHIWSSSFFVFKYDNGWSVVQLKRKFFNNSV